VTNARVSKFVAGLARSVGRDQCPDELYVGRDATFGIGEDGNFICDLPEAEAILVVRGRPELRKAAIVHLLAELELRTR
jgi:hypothetical protein